MGDQREAGVEGGMNSYIYIYRLPVFKICFQTDQQLEWEQIEKIVDGADMGSRGIVDIEQTIRYTLTYCN